jgi:hypothetical protein
MKFIEKRKLFKLLKLLAMTISGEIASHQPNYSDCYPH